jgi:hypothetical protein
MRNKITYTIADASVFLALCQRMERSFIPTGSRVYARETVKVDTDYDFIVAPYLWDLGEPMREFLRACNGGVDALVKIEPLCDMSTYADDPFFNPDEWGVAPNQRPVNGDVDLDGVVYVVGREGGVTVNLVFTQSAAEFGAWQWATHELEHSTHDYRQIRCDKAYRVRRFKEVRDRYMDSCLNAAQAALYTPGDPF